eukprot:359517-Chlamydomonas_euryale.AAC.29
MRTATTCAAVARGHTRGNALAVERGHTCGNALVVERGHTRGNALAGPHTWERPGGATHVGTPWRAFGG